MNPDHAIGMIKAGDIVRIKPEWRDVGDDLITWVAVEDEDGGRVRIQPQIDVAIKPSQVVATDMLMRSEEGAGS